MEVIFVLLFTLVSCRFILVGNPIIIGILLLALSFLIVVQIGFLISSWYAYILFLVYVGGLLVIFIYICIISRNLQLGGFFSLRGLGLTIIILTLAGQFVNNQKILTHLDILNGINFPLRLLLILGVYLLMCFLSVISIILRGGTTINIENN